MLNLVRNPNLNSNHLFRADISLDCPFIPDTPFISTIQPKITQFSGFSLKKVMVRTLIPRNMLVDKPMDQSCLFYEHILESGEVLSLVVYLPHILSSSEMPFYHPAVNGIGFLHKFVPSTKEGIVSIHYCFFDSEPRSEKLERTAQHLLAILHKHGEGLASGYVKKVHHDVIMAQAVVQNTYARLKAKYARNLSQGWVESTDPGKHVFEDLGIAAFLIELWGEMYKDTTFPGFVDIGCGNGLLVHILLEEGFSGWGFDARRRKSWDSWSAKAQENLKELVLIPFIIQKDAKDNQVGVHDGRFPKGTFVVSNHADELTPWTPILATLSESPFMMIPCCSHALSGARFRATPPKGAVGVTSAYASLVAWVSTLAKECGWEVEKEMLRIPSTRNAALIGRRRDEPYNSINLEALIEKNGGSEGWEENALKLVKSATRGH
jgi:tRNASer (uridine44-2'-O)-methyltransferase